MAKIFCLILILALTSVAFAATPPRGAVRLSTNKLFSVGSIRCGKIRNQWIPGRMISGGYFYSRTAERNNLILQSRTASGSKKRGLLRKAANLLTKRQSETPSCAEGPPVENTPTPTPTPTVTITPTSAPSPVPTISLTQINPNLFYTEHSIFIIPAPGQVTWTGPSSWNSVYSTPNMDSYINTLKANFPDDYFHVTITAKNLLPDTVPNALTFRHLANGIGEDTITGIGVPNICRYNAGDSITLSTYGVLEHEFGHNWGVFIGSELGEGHWRTNSNADGQMADNYSDDGFVTIKRIRGNPTAGFTWEALNNLARNETETFSEHDLYLQGLAGSFPDFYILNSPVYNSNGTVSHSGVTTYNQAWVETRNGVRSPSYRTSQKRFRLGFVYVARDLAEVNQVYSNIEKSITHFAYAETIDTINYKYQVPFLPLTKFRASVDARLANLDGNHPPTLTITSPEYQVTSNGSASVNFTASDPDGAPPTVSCVPAVSGCSVVGNVVNVTGLATGSHFYTIKAEDSGGKKTFAHFVIDAPS